MTDIAGNLKQVRQRLDAAARAAGRDPATITLVAVAKGHTETDVRAVLAAGQLAFGENRVQEAKAKYAALRPTRPGMALHLIGPLQTNKTEEAVRLFDVIETLDRPKLATALAAAVKKTGKSPRFYTEVNIGGEPQKSGVAPGALDEFLRFCREGCGLEVTGLMCIPPQAGDPTVFFRRMKELAGLHRLPHLSMGMSADFEAAVKCGATEVRVGTAIFGERGIRA